LQNASGRASVEETALATEALLACGQAQHHQQAAARGLSWLVDAVEANRHQESAPIGLCFARLWYYERLYPLVACVQALGQAARKLLPKSEPQTVVHSAKL
jgi:squalene-hopene/tetraprenyl-beta-curcumene cyclase